MDTRKTTAMRTAIRAIASAAATVAAGAASAQAPINSNLPPGALPSSWDTHYNVCRGVDPKCYRNWVNDRQDKVLVYSRTGGPRHANLGSALGAGKNTQNAAFDVTCTAAQPGPPAVAGNCLVANNTAQAALRAWLNAEGIAVDITEDVNQMSNLNQYKAVIFMSPTRDTMWKHGTALATTNTNLTNNGHLDAAKTALRQYIRAGGGFVGIHNAFGTEYNWPYYEGLLGNANYYDHGANQSGVAHVVGSADSSTAGLPASFTTIDEWYNLMPYPTNVKFLLRLDESTLATQRTTHPGHGSFHPVSWCQYYDGGRSWVTTLGHDRNQFIDGSGFAGQPEFKRHVVDGIKSAMGLLEFCKR
jgi:uncharacterized protein